ncbi:MAG: hypothetical protein LBU41_03145 [Clostridiales Family XIII bacterium]|jgi:hypothetical protein|nr:hypothetical protein [Clostridiales Family XIII bacterium]
MNNIHEKKSERRWSAGRIFWGLFFVAAAAIIVLNLLGIIAISGFSLGTILLSTLLLIILIASLPHLFWFGIFFPALGLLILLAEPFGLNIGKLNLWAAFGVALLLSIGFSILFHPRKRYHKYNAYVHVRGYKDAVKTDEYEQVIDEPDGEDVFEKTSFGSTIKYVNSLNFKHAVLECSFGAMKVYFDNARINGSEASIDCNVSFGAMELYVPKEWRIVNRTHRSLSGFDEKNPGHAGQNSPTVTLTGNVSFGALTIIYV